MATINEKLVDMLSTIQEMRKSMQNQHVPNNILDFIQSRSSVTQEELFEAMPKVSPRTIRRRINLLLKAGKIIKQKEGRQVRYYPH